MESKYEEQTKKIIANQTEALAKQDHLSQQKLDGLDLDQVTPLTPDIISR